MRTSPFLAGVAAVAVALALAGCEREAKQVEANAATAGQRLDRALDRTQQKLAEVGEKTQQRLAEAGEKTQQTLAEVTDKSRQNLAEAGARGEAAVNAGAEKKVGQAGDRLTTRVTTGERTSVQGNGINRETLSDAAITASIKAGFLKDPDLSVLKIDVDTNAGVVTLNGLAATEEAKVRAERSAGAVKGVKEVRNHLAVKKA